VKEAATMRLLHHPCVLPLQCSFVHKQNLWMVEPYVAGGSVLNIMKYAYPDVRVRLALPRPPRIPPDVT
jgi:serine/threonine-protein kinase OSR1/STK39